MKTNNSEKGEAAAVKHIQNVVQQLYDQAVSIDDLILSQQLAGKYKNPNQKHVWVAKKRLERDSADIAFIGERVQFAMIDPVAEPIRNNSQKSVTAKGEVKTWQLAEDPAYMKLKKYPYNTAFYIDRQLKNPLTELMTWILFSDQIIKSEDDDFSIENIMSCENATQENVEKFLDSNTYTAHRNKKKRYTYEQAYDKTFKLLFCKAKKRIIKRSFADEKKELEIQEQKQKQQKTKSINKPTSSSDDNDNNDHIDKKQKNTTKKSTAKNKKPFASSNVLKNHNIIKFAITNYNNDDLKGFIGKSYQNNNGDIIFDKQKYSQLRILKHIPNRLNIELTRDNIIQDMYYDDQFTSNEIQNDFLGKSYLSVKNALLYYKTKKYTELEIISNNNNHMKTNSNKLIVELDGKEDDRKTTVQNIYYDNDMQYDIDALKAFIGQVFHNENDFKDYTIELNIIRHDEMYVFNRLNIDVDQKNIIKDIYYDRAMQQRILNNKYESKKEPEKKKEK